MATIDLLYSFSFASLIVALVVYYNTTISLISTAFAIFLSYGAYKLSYEESRALYAYIPLGILIIAILWGLYLVFTLLIPKRSDWGEDVKGLMKSNEEVW